MAAHVAAVTHDYDDCIGNVPGALSLLQAAEYHHRITVQATITCCKVMVPGCLTLLYLICQPTSTGPSGATLTILLAMALEAKRMRILAYCSALSLLVALTDCGEVFADFERIQVDNQQYCAGKEYSPHQCGRANHVFSFAGADADANDRPTALILQFQGRRCNPTSLSTRQPLGGQDFLLFPTIRRTGANQAKIFLTRGAYSSGLTLRDDYQFMEYDTKQGYYKTGQLPLPDTLLWHLYKMKPAVAQPVPELLNDYFLGACSISTIYLQHRYPAP